MQGGKYKVKKRDEKSMPKKKSIVWESMFTEGNMSPSFSYERRYLKKIGEDRKLRVNKFNSVECKWY